MTTKFDPKPQSTRRRDLDAMGMLVVLFLIFFHTGQIFSTDIAFAVKNDSTNYGVSFILGFFAQFGMPLMMLITGMSIWYSLRKRTAGEFIQERVKRILIPLVFGILIITPIQVWTKTISVNPDYYSYYFYFGVRGGSSWLSRYRAFYDQFLDVRIDLRGFPFVIASNLSPSNPSQFDYMHIWFLVCLFGFTLILLPVFLYLRRPTGKHTIDRLGHFVTRPGAIFILGLPIALIEAVLKPEEFIGWWNRWVFAVFLLYGFIFASDKRFRHALQRHWKIALLLGVLTSTMYLGGMIGFLTRSDPINPFLSEDLWSYIWRALKGISGWVWIIFWMGFFSNLVQPSRRVKSQVAETSKETRAPTRVRNPVVMERVAKYASEAQLPFYVLHLAVITVIGFFVVQWSLHWFIKYWIISLASLVGTLLLYDIGVRRIRVTRFLFGMKSLQPRE